MSWKSRSLEVLTFLDLFRYLFLTFEMLYWLLPRQRTIPNDRSQNQVTAPTEIEKR